MPAVKKVKKTSKKKKAAQINRKANRPDRKPSASPPVPHTRRPDDMTDPNWQTALRRQMAEKETFALKNLGHEPVYSDYSVYSASSKNTYKVALRSRDNSLNFCSCPDFKTNQLGTCKHIEAARIHIGRRRGIKRMLDDIPVLTYSSLYVSYLGERKLKLRIGTDNKKKFEKWASAYFDKNYHYCPGKPGLKSAVSLQ